MEASLTNEERRAELKLAKMRDEIADNAVLNRTAHNFFEHKEVMESCRLFKALNKMPKGALHHLHTSAAIPIEAYVEVTYDDRVYFSQRESLFRVYPKHENVADGFLKCTELRKFYSSPEQFDAVVRKEILLHE